MFDLALDANLNKPPRLPTTNTPPPPVSTESQSEENFATLGEF